MSPAPFSEFLIGHDDFKDLRINPTALGSFYYFSRKHHPGYVKYFVLEEKQHVNFLCQVILIKKNERFTPRLAFSIRDAKKRIQNTSAQSGEVNIKASVSLEKCHENFWALISYLQSLRQIDIPKVPFSLVSSEEGEIVDALRRRKTPSLISIIKQLSQIENVSLSHEDVNELLKRRDKLSMFEIGMNSQEGEAYWQNFFEENKWIFGYGLNYHILRQEQSQPSFGGTSVSGTGAQKGDFLVSTVGDISFTVLVEIKTPNTALLQGHKPIRSGAWSLSKDLTDALSQIEANLHEWELRGSQIPDNRDKLERERVYTVHPKGIVVIGSLQELESDRTKWETFQRFRRAIHGIEIMTFDELYARAKFIVENKT